VQLLIASTGSLREGLLLEVALELAASPGMLEKEGESTDTGLENGLRQASEVPPASAAELASQKVTPLSRDVLPQHPFAGKEWRAPQHPTTQLPPSLLMATAGGSRSNRIWRLWCKSLQGGCGW
jgi:hypothetical protein